MKISNIKFIIILYILHSQIGLLRAQNSYSNFKLNKNIRHYYKYINNAELLVLKKHAKEATLYYDSAFSINRYPFVKDIYNALIANLEIKNDKNALMQYYKLQRIGVVDSELVQNENVRLFLQKNHSSKKVHTLINTFLKDTLKQLYKIDQYHRLLAGEDYSNYIKQIKTDDSVTGTKLLRLFKKYGFPNEYDIGVENTPNIYWLNFYIIIWHQGTNQQINFIDEILKAVNNGKIEAHIAAFLIDKYYGDIGIGGNSIYGTSAIKGIKCEKENIDSCCFVRNFSVDNSNQKMQLITQNIMRDRIGIETLQESQQKIIFKYKGTPYLFTQYFGSGLIYYNIDSKEGLEMFDLKNMINIKDDTYNK